MIFIVSMRKDVQAYRPAFRKSVVAKIDVRKTRWCFSIPAASIHAANGMVAAGKTATKTINISAVLITTSETFSANPFGVIPKR